MAVFKSPTNKQQKPRVRGGTDGIFGTSGGIGFTKENELFVGRVAASLLGEAVTGKGILAQLNLETGIPITEANELFDRSVRVTMPLNLHCSVLLVSVCIILSAITVTLSVETQSTGMHQLLLA